MFTITFGAILNLRSALRIDMGARYGAVGRNAEEIWIGTANLALTM